MATTELIKELLEAGVHFGHQTKRWNPKMKRFIFGEKRGIYIIDLEKTVESIQRACDFLRELVRKGESVLFVGTKKQVQEIVKEEASRCGVFFVNERWLGGTLTNFQTIKKSVKRLEELLKMQEDGTASALKKKEQASIAKEIDRLRHNLSGIVEMKRLPAALFIIDPKKETTALREARRLKIPVVALVDTNCDPDTVDYVIPGNDDAIKSVRIITKMLADSIQEARQEFLASFKTEEVLEAVRPSLGLGVPPEAQPGAEGEAPQIEIPEEEIEKEAATKLKETKAAPKMPKRRSKSYGTGGVRTNK